MKKWILFFIGLTIIVLAITINIFIKGHSPLRAARDEAVQEVKHSTDIVKVKDFYLYHGSKSIYTVVGETKNGEKKVAFIPENKKSGLTEIKWAKGISKEDALNKLTQEKHPKKILGIRLGLEKVGPIWEISYLDNEGDLNYYYLLFKSGDWWKTVENI
ncbi:cell wall elongation regulator TseB-like domain-containing protein [Falsibacillus albus]|uniref:Peptidase n=1 Tax=Falsibacillus albus TaxID=2478915 RepID=A0A3L7JX74_9BACI|nr:DUF5590 domain-containing protein [Falsibacillus albus]RLQ95130.1 peptidase [Falsibacillus albus]